MTEQNKKKKKNINLNMVCMSMLFLVIIGIFAIRNARASGDEMAAGLTGNITQTRAQIKGLPAIDKELDNKLAAARDALAATQSGFPDTLDRNGVVKYILDTAGQCEIQVLPLSSDGWFYENIGQEYNVLAISISASGSLENLKKFMDSVLTGRYPTLKISNFVVDRLPEEGNEFPGAEMMVSAYMTIGIYTFGQMPEAGGQ